jgi:hypothetical protein
MRLASCYRIPFEIFPPGAPSRAARLPGGGCWGGRGRRSGTKRPFEFPIHRSYMTPIRREVERRLQAGSRRSVPKTAEVSRRQACGTPIANGMAHAPTCAMPRRGPHDAYEPTHAVVG